LAVGYETMTQFSSPEDENMKLKTLIKIRAISQQKEN
jgi:hypothetical protein